MDESKAANTRAQAEMVESAFLAESLLQQLADTHQRRVSFPVQSLTIPGVSDDNSLP